jgi:hypothetical protein
MGRQDFGRSEFALPFDNDYIGAIEDIPSEHRSRSEGGKIIRGVEFANFDFNSPDAEVKDVATYLREKQDARKRGVATDWNPETGEILLLAFYNNFTVETLNRTLAEARERYGKDALKQMAISLAVEEARGRRFELHRWQFEKVESRCNSRYWVYVKVLGKRVKSPPVVDVKPDPKPTNTELKPLMTVSEYQAALERKDALDKEIERLKAQGRLDPAHPIPCYSVRTF